MVVIVAAELLLLRVVLGVVVISGIVLVGAGKTPANVNAFHIL